MAALEHWSTIGAWALALIFAFSGIEKMRDLSAFSRIVADYQIAPAAVSSVLAIGIVGAELSGALLSVVPITRVIGVAIIACLLAIFFIAVSVNLARGRSDISCGCTPGENKEGLGPDRLVKLFILFSIAAGVLYQSTTLSVSGVVRGPLELFSGVAGGAAFALLFLCFEIAFHKSRRRGVRA